MRTFKAAFRRPDRYAFLQKGEAYDKSIFIGQLRLLHKIKGLP